MHDLEIDLQNGPRSNGNIPIKSYFKSNFLGVGNAIKAMFVLSVTVYEMIMLIFQDGSFRIFDLQKVGHGHELQCRRIVVG